MRNILIISGQAKDLIRLLKTVKIPFSTQGSRHAGISFATDMVNPLKYDLAFLDLEAHAGRVIVMIRKSRGRFDVAIGREVHRGAGPGIVLEAHVVDEGRAIADREVADIRSGDTSNVSLPVGYQRRRPKPRW